MDQAPDPALDRVLRGAAPAFALLHRPEVTGADRVEILTGPVTEVARLADLPLPDPAPDPSGAARTDLLALVPYRQVAERGFAAVDDGTPLLAMTVQDQQAVPLAEVLDRLPDLALDVSDGEFDISDQRYAELVRRVVADEIGRGEGANFVLRRSFVATIAGYTPLAALTVFRRLLCSELGAYWTFVVHTGSRTLVGATPERHVSYHDGVVTLNPISGTLRYPPTGPSVPETLRFLADRKETDELYMVVDEELKLMARMCPRGGRVLGPYLKEMAHLAHTEYFLEGRSGMDVRQMLHETLFMPTVTGSPLESAFRVLARYEPDGRGYYSGLVAAIGRDAAGQRTLDSAILIRTVDIDAAGRARIPVGSTLVRHSDPTSEAAETVAKAAGVLAAVQRRGARRPAAGDNLPRLGERAEVVRALRERNVRLSRFWFADPGHRAAQAPELAGHRILVVDAEDMFTAMLGMQLAALGPAVTIRRFDEPYRVEDADLVVIGPGPGDPRDDRHPKIAALRGLADRLLAGDRPFLAVCLGHQVLSRRLGLDLARRPVPNQGVQREIDLFGTRRRVGFYNTFAALAPTGGSGSGSTGTDTDTGAGPGGRAGLLACADPVTREVHALRGPGFRSMQFHPESVLTEDGIGILREALTGLLAAPTGRPELAA